MRPKLAFVPWGDVFEDFYGSIGVSIDDYCASFTGSWHVGLIRALKRSGVETVVYYASTRVDRPERRVHEPTGAVVCLVPAPRAYRAIYRRMIHPHHSFGYWSGVDGMFGVSSGAKRAWLEIVRTLAPYLARPLRGLARELRRDGCVAILAQDYENAGFDKLVLLGRLFGLPVHAVFQGGASEWNRLGRFVRPFTMKRAAGFVIGPEDETRRVRDRYGVPAERLHRVFNALDDSAWAPADRASAREAFGIPDSAEVVVWHGRVDIYIKGLDVLMDAWEIVCRERPGRELRLAMLGDGQDASALRQRIEALRARNVHWIEEFVSDRRFIRTFLATGDVYVFPSRIEGQPIAPVEAMAAGLPVVAAGASGVREIFERGESSGGVVVPVDDVAALAAALGRVLDDGGLRSSMASAAKKRAEAFASEVVGRELRAVLLPEPLAAERSALTRSVRPGSRD
jgi:glycosyltransferase involved in cell wall biosynthesis